MTRQPSDAEPQQAAADPAASREDGEATAWHTDAVRPRDTTLMGGLRTTASAAVLLLDTIRGVISRLAQNWSTRTVRLVAGLCGIVLLAGMLVTGVWLSGSEGNFKPPAPMDESIRDFQFIGATFDPDVQDPVKLTTANALSRSKPKIKTGEPVPYYLVGKPIYADLDADNDLDAAVLLNAWERKGDPSLYVWTWEDGKAVQAKYPAAPTEDCANRVQDVKAAGHAIKVNMKVGAWCDEDSTQKPFSYDVTMENTYPVRDHGKSAVDVCESDQYQVMTPGAASAPQVAPRSDAPKLGETNDFTNIEVLNQPSNPPGWNLTRMTDSNSDTVCAWTKAQQ